MLLHPFVWIPRTWLWIYLGLWSWVSRVRFLNHWGIGCTLLCWWADFLTEGITVGKRDGEIKQKDDKDLERLQDSWFFQKRASKKRKCQQLQKYVSVPEKGTFDMCFPGESQKTASIEEALQNLAPEVGGAVGKEPEVFFWCSHDNSRLSRRHNEASIV